MRLVAPAPGAKWSASTPVEASSRAFDAIHPAAGHDLDAPGGAGHQFPEGGDPLDGRAAAPGGEDAAAAAPDDPASSASKGSRAHVERPVENDLHFSGRGDKRRRALRIDTPVGAQQSQNHAVGPAFAGEADLIGHLAEFTVGIAEIPAPRTDHHAEPDARNTARQPDRRSRRGRAALPRRGAQFDARDPGPGRHGARFDGVGA